MSCDVLQNAKSLHSVENILCMKPNLIERCSNDRHLDFGRSDYLYAKRARTSGIQFALLHILGANSLLSRGCGLHHARITTFTADVSRAVCALL